MIVNAPFTLIIQDMYLYPDKYLATGLAPLRR